MRTAADLMCASLRRRFREMGRSCLENPGLGFAMLQMSSIVSCQFLSPRAYPSSLLKISGSVAEAAGRTACPPDGMMDATVVSVPVRAPLRVCHKQCLGCGGFCSDVLLPCLPSSTKLLKPGSVLSRHHPQPNLRGKKAQSLVITPSITNMAVQ